MKGIRLQPDSAETTSVKAAAHTNNGTDTNVIRLATRAATPATMMTAFAKRSPVPRGSVSEAARRRRMPVDIAVVTQDRDRRLQVVGE